jgi:hypothetical protein
MPVYDYFCESNGRTIEVRHRVDVELGTWGEVCYAAHLPLGDTDFLAPVRKRLSPAALAFPVSDSTLRNQGFTKLVNAIRAFMKTSPVAVMKRATCAPTILTASPI